jgi:transposase-like protein
MALDSESFLPDAEDCAEAWRRSRWDEGLYCPECGSGQVQTRQENYRDHLHRYYCEACGKWFIDTTGTFLEASNVSLRRWVYFAREMDKGRAAEPIGEEIDVTKKTARRMAKTMRQALHAQREEWLSKLSGEVEADDVHVKGGQQGRDVSEQEGGRAARMRGLSERGRGTYAGDRPLVVSWVERGGKGRVFELRRSAGKKSLLSSGLSHVEEGSQVDTDTWSGYRLLGEVYQHRSVKHSEEYVSEEGAHCNTAEGEWSLFKPWWRRFRGIAKRYLHLYLSHHSFRRTYRDWSRIERTQAMIGFLILGVFW